MQRASVTHGTLSSELIGGPGRKGEGNKNMEGNNGQNFPNLIKPVHSQIQETQ